MTEQPVVDLGEIRGDWNFHARYVTNALEQTLKRANKLWRELKANSAAVDEVPMDGDLMEEFIEACRQTRALTDDILLLRDIKPAKASKARSGRRRKATRTARK
jgi:hypothetical protein